MYKKSYGVIEPYMDVSAGYELPRVIPQFVSESERIHLITTAEDNLSPSTISSDKVVDTSVRKSDTSWVHHTDPIAKEIMTRASALVGRTWKHCESIQVLRYSVDGQYKPHYDAHCFATGDGGDIVRGGQRIATVLIALNDGYQGGSTNFPNLKRSFKMQPKDALLFHNLDKAGECTRDSLHGGDVVTDGTKWVANVWIHENERVT